MANKLKEKEKKQKIRQLEADIKEMKRDHRETFVTMKYPTLDFVMPNRKQLICGAVGAALILIAGLLLWFNAPTFGRFALFRIKNLRFTRTIFFLPLIISALILVICKRKKAVFISFIPEAALAVIGIIISIQTEQSSLPIWLYAILYSVLFIGAGLIAGSVYAYYIYKTASADKLKEPSVNGKEKN